MDELAAGIEATVYIDVDLAIQKGLKSGLPIGLDGVIVFADDETGGGLDPAACSVIGTASLRPLAWAMTAAGVLFATLLWAFGYLALVIGDFVLSRVFAKARLDG